VKNTPLRKYHAAVWDEPLVMQMGSPGRRGGIPPVTEEKIRVAVGNGETFVPVSMRRKEKLDLPELSEFEVERHYLHLSQQTLGMMGISLFGTCTMKYNPRVNERLVYQPYIAEMHPHQHVDTLQGVLEVIYRFDEILRDLSGMDKFIFQPGGGADAAYTQACITRAYHASRGELAQRNEIITTAQAHPCNPATAAAAGFTVITLPLEADGFASIEALKAAVSPRTAALMVNNPDDIGIYNPHIREWVEIVHAAGGLCFYDHANFNGVMTRIRAAELGFDACMFMLHKTFGGPKGGGGPAVGAYGCTEKLIPFLPGPIIDCDKDGRYTLVDNGPLSIGRVREFWGNVPVVVRAYAWTRAMGSSGLRDAANISVLANNYMEKRLLEIPGITKALPELTKRRLEMTRYSLGDLTNETGVSTHDVQDRMTDFGIDAYWMSHEPWFIPEPFTPEAGELWSIEDIDYWIKVLAHVCDEARTNPEIVKSAPHNQVVHRIDGSALNDPDKWATTWRAYKRKSKDGASEK
jgi:glycine dehydrogenase subunit 2